MKTTLLFLFAGCITFTSLLAATVDQCGGGIVDADAGDGIAYSDVCGETNAFINTVNGNITVSGTGELNINADIGTVNGAIEANNTAIIRMFGNVSTIGGDINLASGTFLLLDGEVFIMSGNINVAAGASLIITGSILNMNGTINVDGELEIDGSVTSTGTIDITGSGTTTIDGGTIESTGGGVTIGPDATVEMTNGSTIETDDGVDNEGTITSDGDGNTIDGGVSGGDLPPGFEDCENPAPGDPPCMDNAVLPVEWVYFNAIEEGQSAALSWQTASELNNDRFEIQKSLDGQTFATIAEVMGQGTTSETVNYSFVDFDFRQDSYYRLKQVDFDGAYEYTGIHWVEKSFHDAFLLKHNPISARRPFQLNLPTDYDVSVAIVAMNGQRVAECLDMTTGEAERQINTKLPMIDKGLYVVMVKTALGTIREQLLIMDVNY